MQLKTGILNETVKYKYGSYFEEAWAVRQEDREEWYFRENHIRLISAKNDYSAFQVLLKSNEDFILTISDKTVFMPQAHLPMIRLSLDFEQKLEWDLGTEINIVGLMEDDDRILKAETLLHEKTVFVKGNMGQPVWIEVGIPGDFKPGMIKGQVKLFSHRLFEDETLIDSMGFEIEVMDIRLPDPINFKFFLDLWQHPSNIARKYNVELWSDEHFSIMESYTASMAKLGQKSAAVVVSEVPWSGQRCYSVLNYPSNMFEYNIIGIEKNEKDRWIFDFTALDTYVEQCFKYGIDKEIEVFGLVNIWYFPQDGFGGLADDYPDAVRLRYYDRKTKTYKFIINGDEIKNYIRELERHFIEKGWIDLVRVMADEPHDADRFSESLKTVRETAPSFKYKAAIGRTSFFEKFKKEITDFVPAITCLIQEWEAYGRMRQGNEGRKLWYTAGGFKPDSCIKSELLENRFIGWLSAYMEMDGFLRWNYTAWPERPNERISWNYPSWPAGDTCFVYPGASGKPVLTLRYKNLKRGIQDFELIYILKEVSDNADVILKAAYKLICKTDTIENMFSKLNSNKGDICCMNYNEYESARKMIMEEIHKYTS